MKLLQDNPLGMSLAGVSGFFVLLALGMAIVGTLPVSVDMTGAEIDTEPGAKTKQFAGQVGDLEDYQIVNEKPVFNESRAPVISEDDEEGAVDDDSIEIQGAPDVRLTGVVITPGMKIASLTPADGSLEPVMAHEGDSLTGEFVGWQVTAVNPRTVVLESRDGQSMELDLQVHDAKIEEPPKPEPVPTVSAALQSARALAGGGSDSDVNEDEDEPLSRAEQIRQRIAERRAELRREQEEQQAQSAAQAGTAGTAPQPTKYQSAIREMMKNKRKDQGSNDDTDG